MFWPEILFLTVRVYSESDDSDNEAAFEAESYLMDEMGLVEGALVELTHEHQLGVKVCKVTLFLRLAVRLKCCILTLFSCDKQYR